MTFKSISAKCISAAAALGLAAIAVPASAEVIETSASGFTTRDSAVVEAAPQAIWLALITPGEWWNDAHTWSGAASNMTLEPQAGGCFCERIPASEEDGAIGLEGSVRHMTVVQSFPRKVLRMRGGLGPLQSEPADGVLTITLKPVDGATRILWEYVVGGHMRFEVPVIARAVDGVMSQQLKGIADRFGGAIDTSGGPDAAEDQTAPEEELAEGAAEAAARDEDSVKDAPARARTAEEVARALDALGAGPDD